MARYIAPLGGLTRHSADVDMGLAVVVLVGERAARQVAGARVRTVCVPAAEPRRRKVMMNASTVATAL